MRVQVQAIRVQQRTSIQITSASSFPWFHNGTGRQRCGSYNRVCTKLANVQLSPWVLVANLAECRTTPSSL
jgi:hypothetical protein